MKTAPTFTLVLSTVAGACCVLGGWGVSGKEIKAATSKLAQTTAPTSAIPVPKPAGASAGVNSAAPLKPQRPVQAPVAAPGPAAAPTPKPLPPPVNALATLRSAREKLTAPGIRSIKSRIIERVSIDGRRLRLEGTYRQGTDLRLKLEFKVLPETAQQGVDGSFLEVCDGTILWTRHQIGKDVRITRRDARQILNTSRSSGVADILAVELGLGGLPALLASLEQSMTFDRLNQEEINGKKFMVITGAWTNDVMQRFKNNMGKRKTLPAHFPDAVRIYFEPDVLFPRRIDFLKQASAGESDVLVELDFVDIVINGPLDAHEFEFEPPNGIRTVDVTADYLRQLKSGGAK